MTRRLRATCRCCLGPSESTFCPACGYQRVQDALRVRQAIISVFGLTGLEKYEAEMRSERIQRGRQARITISGKAST